MKTVKLVPSFLFFPCMSIYTRESDTARYRYGGPWQTQSHKCRFSILSRKGIKTRERIFCFFTFHFVFVAFAVQWDRSTCTEGPPLVDHNCKKRASCVGLTMPGRWGPSTLSKSATSTYLSYFSGGCSALFFGGSASLGFAFPLSVGPSAARAAGSQGCPKRVPLVRNSWAKYPANILLDRAGGSEPGRGLISGFTNLGLGVLVEGLGGSKPSSLSLRLFGVREPLEVDVNIRRGGKRIVLVFMMAFYLHATSAPTTQNFFKKLKKVFKRK